MPPPNKFLVVHDMIVQNHQLIDSEAEETTQEEYNSLKGMCILRTICSYVRMKLILPYRV